MRKLVFTVLVFLGMVMSAEVFADSTTSATLGDPINLQNDTSYVPTFPSRLQTVGGGLSAVFAGFQGGTETMGGFVIAKSDMFDILYLYRSSGYAAPTAAADGTLITAGDTMIAPVNIVYGIKLGSLQAGLGYNFASISADDTINNTDGTINTQTSINYGIHALNPGVTLMLGDSMAVDVALPITLQTLSYINADNTGDITNKKTAPLMQSSGLDAQLSFDLSDSFTLALRVGVDHSDDTYGSESKAGTVTSKLTTPSFTDTFYGAIGMKYVPVELLTVYFDVFMSQTDTTTRPTYDPDNPGNQITTVNSSLITFPSANVGLEIKSGNWRFRAFGKMTASKSVTTTYNPAYAENSVSAQDSAISFDYTGGVGVAWVKLPWAINTQFNPDLLNNTLQFVSGNTLLNNDAFLKVQVNYLFDVRGGASASVATAE